MAEENNKIELSKSVNRRSEGKVYNALFGKYEENYGKEADAKLLSWQQMKEMKEITQKIIATVNRKRSEFSSDLAVELVSETYCDLIELQEVLKIRLKIASIIEQTEDFDEEWKTVFAETYDLDLLRAVLKVLEHDTSEQVIPLLDEIVFGLSKDVPFYEIYVESLFKYYKAKTECLYKAVVNFLDSYIYEFNTNDGMNYITDILEEYSSSKINSPFSEEKRNMLERVMPFFVGSGVFEQKNEENLTRLINGVFVRLHEIPQLEEASLEPMFRVEKKLTSNEKVIQGAFGSH